jgi:citrate synthase
VRAVQTKTALTQLVNGMPYFRGYALPDLMRKASMGEMVYMALREEDPTPKEMPGFVKALECARAHALVPDDALAAASASYAAGNSLNAACAAGLLAIDDSPVAIPAELAEAVSESEFAALVVIHQVIGIIAHTLGNNASEATSLDEAFFTALAGRKPTTDEADLARAIFVACVDHTPATPSSLAAITSYSGGNSLKTALAAGISAMGDVHAGAGEGTATFLTEALGRSGDIPTLAQYVIDKFAGKFGGEKSKLPGYGHRYYSMYGEDPRAATLLQIAQERGMKGRPTELAIGVEAILKRDKAPGLCINVDGAIGALIREMGIPPKAGKGTFIIPRTVGILAELREQVAGSFFRLANESIIYTGPEPGREYRPAR